MANQVGGTSHDEVERTRPATAEDFHRLADLAQERGLRVFEASPNHWYCTSSSDPFKLHVVTGFSCDCPGFISHQRCTHHALLLAHLGWLPEIEDEPVPAETCRHCHGRGKVFSEYWLEPRPCEVCGGSGVKPDHRSQGTPSFVPVSAAAAA